MTSTVLFQILKFRTQTAPQFLFLPLIVFVTTSGVYFMGKKAKMINFSKKKEKEKEMMQTFFLSFHTATNSFFSVSNSSNCEKIVFADKLSEAIGDVKLETVGEGISSPQDPEGVILFEIIGLV